MKVFMRRIALALIVVGAVAIAAILPSVIESGPSWEERVRELRQISPYISVHDEGGYYSQSIDKDAAQRGGISKRTFLLASEMLDFQNRLAFEAYRSETLGIPMVEVELREFPKVAEFWEESTEKLEERKTEERRTEGLGQLQIGPFTIGSVGVAQAHLNHGDDASPCGDYDHPIPNEDPTYFQVSRQNPREHLTRLGFHRTRPNAACRDYDCSRDYTRSQSHTTEHGTCRSPFFRDHASVYEHEDGYSLQYREPNPESAFSESALTWPRWNWPLYVRWWHNNID